MTTQQTLESKLQNFEKEYKKEALVECNKCDEALTDQPCTQRCSRPYHLYMQGQRMLYEKYQLCVNKAANDKSKKECQNIALKDLDSLINFIKRVENPVENL